MGLLEQFINFLTANATIIEAIAGLIAIAAVFGSIRNYIVSFFSLHSVKLEAKNDEGCVQETLMHLPAAIVGTGAIYKYIPARDVNSKWLRLRIKNKGVLAKPVANCYVKLLEVKDPNNNIITPFDPALLTWAQHNEAKYANLAKNEEGYIDIVYQLDGENFITLAKIKIPNSLVHSRLFGLQGVYTLKVGVYGDGINGKEYSFKVKNNGNFNSLRFE